MSPFGATLVLVLCTFQHATAIPRPDFGVDTPIYGSNDVSATAKDGGTLIAKVNLNLDVQLTSGYPLLGTVKTQLISIANDFNTKALAVSDAIDKLALNTGPFKTAFDAFNTATTELNSLINLGLNGYYSVLDTQLDKSISTMLSDALTDVETELLKLAVQLDKLKKQLGDAVQAFGSSTLTKAVLRKYVSTTVTSEIEKGVLSLKATIPLVTYIIANSIENLKIADDYINASGPAASDAFDNVGKGLELLETELQQHISDTSQITAIIDPVAQANTDFAGIDLTEVPLIDAEIQEYTTTYTNLLQSAINDIDGYFDTYKLAVPLLSDGLSDFYSANGCSHLVQLVKVLISNGEYADYCYNKYRLRTFVLFDKQAREVGRCADLEVTRLLKLQQVLLAIAKTLLFDVEDLLANVKACVKTPLLCNTSDVATLFSNVNVAAKAHLTSLKKIVKSETEAGLQRVSACFSTSTYKLVVDIQSIIEDIDRCATLGPKA